MARERNLRGNAAMLETDVSIVCRMTSYMYGGSSVILYGYYTTMETSQGKYLQLANMKRWLLIPVLARTVHRKIVHSTTGPGPSLDSQVKIFRSRRRHMYTQAPTCLYLD